MKNSLHSRWVPVLVFLLTSLALAQTTAAQESKSALLAKELSQLLDQAKLDAIAARESAEPDRYVAALYFPGLQLLVVSARYSVPQLLNEKMTKREYRDIYIDLNSASVPDSKTFVEDLVADGLKAKREENQPFDTYETGSKRIAFDGDWKKQKISEEDYLKAFQAADDRYAKMLSALLAQLKKAS